MQQRLRWNFNTFNITHISSRYHPHIIHISSTYHPHFIQILSRFYPHIIQISFIYHPDITHISSTCHPDITHISSRYHPHIVQISYFSTHQLGEKSSFNPYMARLLPVKTALLNSIKTPLLERKSRV